MKTNTLLKSVLLSLLVIGGIFNMHAQSGFTAKNLSDNPVFDASAAPSETDYTITVSDPAPDVSFTDGIMSISCASGQSYTLNAKNFVPDGDYTIEFRVKVPQNNGRGFDVAIRDGKFSHSLYCTTHERLYLNTSTVVNYYLDAKRYHTYRLAVIRETGEVHVWIDGVYKGLGTTVTTTNSGNQLLFGKSNASAVTDIYLDYFTYDLTGAYKPDAIVLEAPDYAKKDVTLDQSLDGTQLPVDAGWTLPTLSGTEYSISSIDGALCLDCPVGNQYLFQSPVSATNNLYTLEFKAKVPATTGRGMDIVIGSNLYCLTNNKLYNNNEKAPLFEFTDEDYHVFRMVGSGTGKHVDVWVDGNYVGVSNTASANKFQLGKSRTADATTLYLDYASIDTSGSFSPVSSSTSIINEIQKDKDALSVLTSKGGAYIYIDGIGEKVSSLKIFSINGQSLQQVNNYLNMEPLNVSFLNKGVYLIQVYEAENNGIIKFIKR